MGFFNKLDRAAALYNGMADRVGVDTDHLVGADEASVMAYRAAIIRCSSCKHPEACAGWQIEHDTASEPPAYCRNHDALKAMAGN